MAGGCFQKMITFLAAGLLIMMLAVNVSEAAIDDDCSSAGHPDCDAAGNNEACDIGGTDLCICATEFTDSGGTCTLNCAALTDPTDGTVSVSGVTGTYTCNTEYTLSHSTARTCSSATWDGSAPTCTFDCPALSNPAAGTVSISGVTGTYTCDAEYTVTGGPTQTCSVGAWGGSPATCVLSCTTPPNPADGTVSVSGVTVTYSCNTEYTISGSATRTCSSSAWTGSAPTCTFDCAALTDPTDGTVSVSGVTGTYTCNTEYTLSHSTARTCSSATWDGSAPTCTFDCTVVLANPADGTVIVSGVTGTYTCNTGFSMTGGPTQTCASGNWGGTVATCALACTGQLDPPDGAVSISANMATFTCEDGYTLSDSTPLTCTTEWSGSAPTCSQNSGVGGPGVSNSLVGIIITCLLTALAM